MRVTVKLARARRPVYYGYPQAVETVAGWALLIGKGPEGLCLSFAVDPDERGPEVGPCINCFLPESVLVDKNPDTSGYPRLMLSGERTEPPYLARMENTYVVVYKLGKEGEYNEVSQG